MSTDTLTLQLLEWVDEHHQSYAEVLDVWRSTCPRHTVWEDACGEGLIACEPNGAHLVSLTAKGRALLLAHRHAGHWRAAAFDPAVLHR
jgi:hypothetical protein